MIRRPFRVKLDYFFQKHKILRPLIIVVLILIVFILLKVLKYFVGDFSIDISDSFIGVFGAVLGSVVGGVLTFCGSVYVNNKQLKSKSTIHRMNTIYKPLYDELVENTRIIKEENPFPTIIRFSKGSQTLAKHPQYSAWGRIKNDNRFIRTPDFLVDSYEKLYKKIDYYLESISKSQEDIQSSLNRIIYEQLDHTNTIQNLADAMFSDILLGDKPVGSLLQTIFISPEKEEFSEDKIYEVEKLIYDECRNLESVKETIAAYNDWLEAQDELVNSLSMIIELIGIKHEKINKKY